MFLVFLVQGLWTCCKGTKPSLPKHPNLNRTLVAAQKRSSLHLDTGHWLLAEHIVPQCQKTLSFLAGRSAFYKYLQTLLFSGFMEGFALLYVGVAGSAEVTRHIWTETSAPAQLNSLHKVLRAWRIRLWSKSDFFQVSKCTRCVY